MKPVQFYFLLPLLLLLSCQPEKNKIPVYAWTGGPGEATDAELTTTFENYKAKGIDGLMYNGGQDPAVYQRIAPLAKAAGLEFHTWIPTMVQGKKPGLDSSWYARNGKGESALTDPAYVPYYTFLCPSEDSVYQFLSDMYTAVAQVPEVDGIHLDYIRFPDVILARGLWDKYGLVMDREYPEYDYCYCDRCVSAFDKKTGIDIRAVEDPSAVEEWKQFRYDLITSIVNRLAADVHAEGKEITAAVFPGPHSIARRIVRQEWDQWELDAFYPMHYNDFYLEDPKWVGEVTKEGVTAIDDRVPLYSGLFICPKPEKKGSEKDPENHGLLPEELETAISTSMENGATGICLFTPERMTEAHWAAFEDAIYR
ncbi:MAG TPA: hypothetical protein VJ953_16995 [Saprospiraceae bacterium]|nr:hypothetical protein [Saprospiraceae bacterium]